MKMKVNGEIELMPYYQYLHSLRRLVIKMRKNIKSGAYNTFHMNYMAYRKILKKIGFFPQLWNTDQEKVWLTKKEAKILRQLANYYQPKSITSKKRSKTKTFIFKCKRCNYFVIDTNYKFGLERIFEHYFKRHNGDFSVDVLIGLTNQNLRRYTKDNLFWNSIRKYGSFSTMISIGDYENIVIKNNLRLPL